jgi:capsular polysaccharide biosynthesis protein
LNPTSQKKRRNIVLSVLFGLVGGIGLAYVREFLDDSIKTNEDVKKRLGLPVLATIEHKEAK